MKLKLLPVALLLLSAPVALSQSKSTLKESGTFGFTDTTERILWDKVLEDKNQLLLVGSKTIQLLDLTTRKVIETRPITLPSLSRRADYSWTWQISPDGRRMLIVGHPDAKIGEEQPAWIWDLETGKRIAVLDQMQNRVQGGWWSRNGRTLVTIDNDWSPVFTRKLGVSFWDGETFEYRTSISIENVTWLHLSDDGERFFAASGKKGNLLGIKYVKDTNAVISMWQTSTGALEKTIAVADASFTPKTREISVSPDDKFLLFVKKHKTNAAENRLLAWEMNGSVHPRYELKPLPRIDDSRIEFSRDGKYFALDVGKNLQIYETATGKKRSELNNVELPNSWLSDDLFFRVEFKSKSFFGRGKKLATFDASSGQTLYKHWLQYEETNTHDISGEVSGSETVDDTQIIRNPRKDLYVTQSNEYVELFESKSGQHLQTVVSPPVVYDKNNKPKLKRGTLVTKAKWSTDGKTLLIFSSDHRSVSLWELVEN